MRATVKVWDPCVRIFHWSLVASFAVAWFFADEVKDLHEWVGSAAAALIIFRLGMGIVGSRYACFTQFIRGQKETLSYTEDMIFNREARYLGHNPLGALMVVALLTSTTLVAVTVGYKRLTPFGASNGSRRRMRRLPISCWLWSRFIWVVSSWGASVTARTSCAP
ncbi:cytochrome b/b6 domain-containing protein [Neomesorhizobium albiziae]|nr:hypothetical protein GCM10007937_40180 [Mesorhizobium albiziae]